MGWKYALGHSLQKPGENIVNTLLGIKVENSPTFNTSRYPGTSKAQDILKSDPNLTVPESRGKKKKGLIPEKKNATTGGPAREI